jgi:hypothetical protein
MVGHRWRRATSRSSSRREGDARGSVARVCEGRTRRGDRPRRAAARPLAVASDAGPDAARRGLSKPCIYVKKASLVSPCTIRKKEFLMIVKANQLSSPVDSRASLSCSPRVHWRLYRVHQNRTVPANGTAYEAASQKSGFREGNLPASKSRPFKVLGLRKIFVRKRSPFVGSFARRSPDPRLPLEAGATR